MKRTHSLFSAYILLGLLFICSCNNHYNSNLSNTTNADSITKSKIYPATVIKGHLEKKYDNAVWLAYASNFPFKAMCDCGKPYYSFDTTLISLEPYLSRIETIGKGDTVALIIFFKPQKSDSCFCHTIVRYGYCSFYFVQQSDSVL